LEQLGFMRSDPSTSALRIFFTKMLYKSTPLVASLRGVAPVYVRGCDDTAKTYGDLKVGIDLNLATTEGDLGAYALKSVTGTTFTRGAILSGLRGSTNIVLTPVAGRGFIDGEGVARGEFTIGAALQSNELGSGVELVALDGVRQQTRNNIFYLAFPQSQASAMTLRATVPYVGIPAGAKLYFWLWFLALRSATVLPVITATYRKLARPGEDCGVQTLPTSDVAIADIDPSVCGALDTDQYVEVNSEEIAVTAGDTLFLRLERAVDVYAADVGVLRMGFEVT
jgi:hypothetical protein